MELILENVRCFVGHHAIPVKPITFLTGENSSGKSTFLAALATVNDFGFPMRPRFNAPPYNLGNFDTIATYKGGRYGRATEFKLGYQNLLKATDVSGATDVVATYRGRQGAVEMSSVTAKNNSLTATVTFLVRGNKISLKVTAWEDGAEHKLESDIESPIAFSSMDIRDLLFFVFYRKDRQISQEDEQRIFFSVDRLFSGYGRIDSVSLAPVRTKPKRTYDQLTEEFTPEGEHIPFVLLGVLENPDTRAVLERFGREAGLFRRITVKKLGNKVSDPIQVLVSNSSRPANLQDVGYGVSQALPIVVESVLISPNQLILLQQPEVHLHPRAQAALGSLFVELHKNNKKQFVIETHSDYIIDRVRQEVAKGRVQADEVQILYFDKKGSETTVHPVDLDEQGNIVNAPPAYRNFFFQEELNLLNR